MLLLLPTAGQGYQFAGNLTACVMHYENALPGLAKQLAEKPDNEAWQKWASSTAADTHYNHASALYQLKRTDEANFHFLETVRIVPDHDKAKQAIGALGLTVPGKAAPKEETASAVEDALGAEAAAAMGLGESMF
jgi:tetratricopeptide (TPR) repeat protein